MTTAEFIKLIGQPTTWTTRGITFNVEIVDVREKFGRVDVLLAPTNPGVTGKVWVDLAKLPEIPQPKRGAVWKPVIGNTFQIVPPEGQT